MADAPRIEPGLLFSQRKAIADRHGMKLTAEFNALVRDVIQTFQRAQSPNAPAEPVAEIANHSVDHRVKPIGDRCDSLPLGTKLFAAPQPPRPGAAPLEDAVRRYLAAVDDPTYQWGKTKTWEAASQATDDMRAILTPKGDSNG